MEKAWSLVRYRYVSGFPDYCVGTDGTVWSRKVKGSSKKVGPWRRLALIPGKAGYVSVHLYRDGRRRTQSVGRLVLLTFVGPCPEGMEMCHFPDRDKLNNRLENLRWDAVVNNHKDKQLHGTVAKGEANGGSKLTRESVQEIRRLGELRVSQRVIAKRFGIGQQTVSRICSRKRWKHLV
jgi:hypothetical protein